MYNPNGHDIQPDNPLTKNKNKTACACVYVFSRVFKQITTIIIVIIMRQEDRLFLTFGFGFVG